jgi:hypothetical protein
MDGFEVDRSRRGRDALLLGYVLGVSAVCACQVYDSSALGTAEYSADMPIEADRPLNGAAPTLDEQPREDQPTVRDGGAMNTAAFEVADCADCAAEHAVAACQDGLCRVVECLGGYRDCDGEADNGCEIAPDDPDHCGACRNSCSDLPHADAQCDGGACAVLECRGNFGDCNGDAADGCETPLDTLSDCGGCGEPCAQASCAGGVCSAVSCADPTADCDGDGLDCETDLSADVNHCGGCDVACAFQTETPHAAPFCADGECAAVCEPGYGDCDGEPADGCEAELATSPAHCGACGNDCGALLPHTAETGCADGRCGVVSCASGWDDCDGVAANGCERSIAAEGPCAPDTDCSQQTFGGHDYFFCTNADTWASARAHCMQLVGGDLVNIGNGGENIFVAMHSTTDAWIGAGDVDSESRWRWIDDAQMFWRGAADGMPQAGRYANWRNGQPDDADANEDCAEIGTDGTWADTACSGLRAFVCEVGRVE